MIRSAHSSHWPLIYAVLLISVLACTPAPALEPADVAGADAMFGDGELGNGWTVVNDTDFSWEIVDGELVFTPHTHNVWWMEDQGPGILREVTGNFRVSTRVYARKASAPDEAVDSGYQFAGLIARDPASAAEGAEENYIFSVVGWRGDYMSAETKTTEDDVSIVAGPDWETGDAELRICRINGTFHLYNRPVGGDTWSEAITYERRDLPATLQVGPIAYTYTNNWDLRARFDYVTFGPVGSLEDCIAD